MTEKILDEDLVLLMLSDSGYSIARFFGASPEFGLTIQGVGGRWGSIPDDVISAMAEKGWLTKPADVNDCPRLTFEGKREAACRSLDLVRRT